MNPPKNKKEAQEQMYFLTLRMDRATSDWSQVVNRMTEIHQLQSELLKRYPTLRYRPPKARASAKRAKNSA